ncbi:Uncharacterised protein [uncultured archaeon]|nr:Uncharacterised protein [uncultured archaeon]
MKKFLIAMLAIIIATNLVYANSIQFTSSYIYDADLGKNVQPVTIAELAETDNITPESVDIEVRIWFLIKEKAKDLNFEVSTLNLPGIENYGEIKPGDIVICETYNGILNFKNCKEQQKITGLENALIPLNDEESKNYIYKYNINLNKVRKQAQHYIYIKYSLKNAIEHSNSNYYFLLHSLCDYYHGCQNGDKDKFNVSRTIILPKSTSMLDQVIPTPDNIEYFYGGDTSQKRTTLIYNSIPQVYLSYFDSQERDVELPVYYAFIGALLGAALSLFFEFVLISALRRPTVFEKIFSWVIVVIVLVIALQVLKTSMQDSILLALFMLIILILVYLEKEKIFNEEEKYKTEQKETNKTTSNEITNLKDVTINIQQTVLKNEKLLNKVFKKKRAKVRVKKN